MTTPSRALITHISEQLGSPLTGWERMTGGQTNISWKAQSQSRTLVIKLFEPTAESPLFPNSARDEARMLRQLGPIGLSPVLRAVSVFENQDVLIYDHLDGSPWHERPQDAARALAVLHTQTPPPDLRQVPGGSAWIERQTAKLLALLPEHDQTKLAALKPHTYVPESDRAVLLHGDPVPGNLIVGPVQTAFIDWQCPAIGDACEDLALFLSPSMQYVYRGCPLRAEDHQEVLTAYGDKALTKRLLLLAPWHHWRMAAYCAWKVARGHDIYRDGMALELAALRRTLA
ncbi:MAG: aminoglycoside phosphotransferase family protein [Thalassovita sp.]